MYVLAYFFKANSQRLHKFQFWTCFCWFMYFSSNTSGNNLAFTGTKLHILVVLHHH